VVASFSTEHIGYLQRSFLGASVSGNVSELFVGIRGYEDIRLLHVEGISRFWMASEQKALATRQLMTDMLAGLHAEAVPLVFLMLGDVDRVGIYIGSYRDNESLAWPTSRGGVNGDVETIAGSLQSAYPGVFLRPCTSADWDSIYGVIRGAPGFSLITGTPSAKVGTGQVGVEQIERLIRGMYGRRWGYMVIAKPYPPGGALQFYNDGLNEMREVANARAASGSHPTADAYGDLLKRYLERHAIGKTTGLWRVTAYCFGMDQSSYLQARAVSMAVFAGEDSLPDPLRLVDCFGYSREVAHLGQLVAACRHPAPGRLAHQYEYASVLNSAELATLAHLPQEGMPGYVVREYARFDVSPLEARASSGVAIQLGDIVDSAQSGRSTGNRYAIAVDALAEHGMITGITGSGKTNTAFNLLKNVWGRGVPFLVIEPAKQEYRQLLDAEMHPQVGGALRVFTLGDERISPFRLNPFQVLPGVPVQTHIGHLLPVFNASFAMYGPMPQVLEQCIYAIYADRGWDMATGQNQRGEHPRAYPTLGDLYDKIDVVVEGIGYGPRITPELKAALKVRINSLRVGGKGLMMDTPLSTPIEVLLERPAVLELQAIGDDDEKAFIMGVLWMFLYEHRAYSLSGQLGSRRGLQHLTLVEEAHRLLANVPITANPEVANTRGKAVETFCNLLSEIRAYGEGMLIVDQIPARLAPDAIKNTNLKIMHRVVSEDDRLLMGGAMTLDENQLRYVAGLPDGHAVVYSKGDNNACLIRVPLTKDRNAVLPTSASTSFDSSDIKLLPDLSDTSIRILDAPTPEIKIGPSESMTELRISTEVDQDPIKVELLPADSADSAVLSITGVDMLSPGDRCIVEQMSLLRADLAASAPFSPGEKECPLCAGPCSHRSLAGEIAAQAEVQRAFTRYVLSCTHYTPYVRSGLKDMVAVISRFVPYGRYERALLTVTLRVLTRGYFRAIGDCYVWPYTEVERLEGLCMAMIENALAGADMPPSLLPEIKGVAEFQALYMKLCQRSHDPFPECSEVCPHGLCVYRFQLAPLAADGQHKLHGQYLKAWKAANSGSSGVLHVQEELRRVAQQAVRPLLAAEVPADAQARAGGCFLVQKAYAWGEAATDRKSRAAQIGVRATLGDTLLEIKVDAH